MNKVKEEKKKEKGKKTKRKRKKTTKTKMLFLEVVILLVIILVMIVIVWKNQFFQEKEENPISLHFLCQYANPWVSIDDSFPPELGQKRYKVVYQFDYVDENIENSYLVETYAYTTVDAYQYDNGLCQSFSYSVTSCEENPKGFTRVVTRDPYVYFSIPETGVTEEWVEEYIDKLENLSFSCQSTELEKNR